MGAVWRADHLTLNAPVAVKLLDPSIANTEEGLARFMREAQAAAALRGTNVVQTFDYGVHEGVPFIVMELLVGQSLADRLTKKGPLPAPAVASILKQIARAITKAHQAGIIHRDLKPDNVFLVDTDDDEPVAKVLDFGIAKANGDLAVNAASKTRTGALLGTPFYMSPEQAQGTMEVDHRSDLWALAVITYEALLGKRPFESEALGDLLLKICVLPLPVPSKVGAVPAGFDAWFAKAANRDPAKRFTSGSEMARALEKVVFPGMQHRLTLDSVSIDAIPIPTGPAGDSLEGTAVVAAGGAKKRPAALFGGAAVAAVAVLMGVGVAVHGDRAPSAAAESARAPSTASPRSVSTESTPVVQEPVKVNAPQPSTEGSAATTPPAVSADAPAAEPPPAAATAEGESAGAPVHKTRAAAAKRSGSKSGHGKSSAGEGSFDPLEMRR